MRIEKGSSLVAADATDRAATRAAKRAATQTGSRAGPRAGSSTASTPASDSAPPPGPASGEVFHAGHASYRLATHAELQRSALNVRRQRPDDVAELAALIRSQGLLQNLICYEEGSVLHIVAGERRYAAVGLLIRAGELPADFAIPCLLVPVEEAVAISLAENSGREAMHPADVFEAMRELAARGASIEDIAMAFGVSTLTVRRRLKLAHVAPRFITMYRDNGISFEQLAALAICDDHATQEQAWDSLDKWSRAPATLRRLLTAQQVDVRRDRLARFVGVAQFEAAGGIIVRDLFSDDDAGYIEDAALLLKLATDKLTQAAAPLHEEGWAWVAVQPLAREADLAQYGRVRVVQRALTEAERDEVAVLEADIASIRSTLDDLERGEAPSNDGSKGGAGNRNGANLPALRIEAIALDGDEQRHDGHHDEQHDERQDERHEERQAQLASLQQQWDALDARLEAIHAGTRTADRAEHKLAGAVVTIGENGALLILRDLIRPSDKHGAREDLKHAAATKAPPKVRAMHSDKLIRNLAAQRTVALHAQMMTRPTVALAVLVHDLVRRVFDHQSASATLTGISLRMPDLPDEVSDSRAMAAVNEKRAQLAALLAECPDHSSLLAWMLGQPPARLLELLAFCMGCSLDTVSAGEMLQEKHKELAKAVELDMRAWWQPTAANYWQHVPKSRTVDVVLQALSPEQAQPLLTLSKDVLAQRAEQMMAATGWLPPALHT